jgi:hypothetical protein
MKARTQLKSKGNYDESADSENVIMEDEEELEVVEQKQQSICNISVSNFDLGHLVNRWPEDPVELHPFDIHFTMERIIKTWQQLDFCQ